MRSQREFSFGGNKNYLDLETNRSISKIMLIIEKYTNYEDLTPDKKDIVRDTVLNQINRLSRVVGSHNTIIFGDNNTDG